MSRYMFVNGVLPVCQQDLTVRRYLFVSGVLPAVGCYLFVSGVLPVCQLDVTCLSLGFYLQLDVTCLSIGCYPFVSWALPVCQRCVTCLSAGTCTVAGGSFKATSFSLGLPGERDVGCVSDDALFSFDDAGFSPA